MSNGNSNTKQTPPKLDILHLATKIKTVFPAEFVDKVKFLCKAIARVEWSGVLFYKIEGSMKKPEQMVITLHDILLMDKGTGSYTSFDWDEDVVEYQMDNPELMDMTIGHIHSHNTMGVFFSGTDWSELNDNCPNHNFYLSVIVNNFLDAEAKIAFTGSHRTFVCKDETGKDYTLAIKDSDLKPVMLVYDCEVELPTEEIVVPEAFSKRYDKIENKYKIQKEKEAKEEEARKKSAANTHNVNNQVVQGDFFKGGSIIKKSGFPDYNPNQKAHSGTGGMNPLNQMLAEEFGSDENYDADFTKQTIEQEFATFVLRLGNQIEDDELVDALEDIESANLNPQSMADSIGQSIGVYYDSFFEGMTKYQGDKAFLDVLEELVDIFTEFQKDYDFLESIVATLKEIGVRMEATLKEGVLS